MGHYYDVIKATQKSAKAVAKERTMAAKMKNPAGKMRKQNQPYATWTDLRTGWKYKLLKSWQANNAKPYGRWFVSVTTPYVTEEMGDSYVAQLLPGMPSAGTTFDNAIWPDLASFIQWAWGE